MKHFYLFLMILFIFGFTTKLYSQSVPSYVPTNGLVGWWGFNGNAQDGSGNGNHGTVNGATLTTDRFGNQNGAYSFDGTTSYVKVNNSSSLESANLSISFWIKSTGNQFQQVFYKVTPNTALNETYSVPLNLTQTGTLNFDLKNNNCNPAVGWQYCSGNIGNISSWTNFVLTHDGSITRIYKNGQLLSTIPGAFPISNCPGGDLLMGCDWQMNNKLNGQLDDIGIWNRALTQQEITNLYNSQNPQPCTTSITNNLNIIGCGFAVLSSGDTVNQSGTYIDTLFNSMGCDSILNQIVTIQNPSICNPVPFYVPTNGLVGWWGFNGNAQDGSGNGNHGTVNGATLTTDRFGNQNGAYSFDGVGDYIDVNLNSILSNGLSISVWINTSLSNASFGHKGIIWNRLSGPQGNPPFPPNQGTGIMIYHNGLLCLASDGNNLVGIENTGQFYNNSLWYHIVFSYNNNTASTKIHVNGIEVLSNTTSIIGGINLSYTSVKFGKDEIVGYGNRNWFGLIDDIGIWNRALTQQEITNLYNSQLPTQTSLCLPSITTNPPSSIGIDSVIVGGNITNDGGSSIVLRGVCYSTTPNPNMGNMRTENGSGVGSFSTILRNLNPSTTYYVRSYAKNLQGVVVYGNEVSFSTGTPIPSFSCGTSTVSDVDGNNYNTVQIGAQCWTQSNLKVSKYRNGDNIPTGLSNSAWENTTAGAYAAYDNNPGNDGLYGNLYNHYAVMNKKGLCPMGWHVPTDGEWTNLETFLGGSGGALKSTATQPTPGGWNSPNTGATNSSGFSAEPGGWRSYSGGFHFVGFSGYWWSSSLSGPNAWRRGLNFNHGIVNRNANDHLYGFSVRCLRD